MSRRVVLVVQASKGSTATERLAPVAQALLQVGLDTEFVAYDDDAPDLRSRLARADGVLVWVDPVPDDGRDRSHLDTLLRDVSAGGVWVSTHPDTIVKMGTKDVVYRTRELGWGSDARRYRTVDEFTDEFPTALSEGVPRVLKPYRGNGGIGVQKVELVTHPAAGNDSVVRVQSARLRDEVTEDMSLQQFMESCTHHFDATNGGPLIDQPFQPRITEGIIRCYIVKDEVVGFARQYPSELAPGVDPAARRVFGLPAQKTMFAPDEPTLSGLRTRVESEWVPAMQALVDVDTASLPALWDADFLLGPRTALDEDTYVLCEINVSSVLPFPPQAPPKVARATLAALRSPR